MIKKKIVVRSSEKPREGPVDVAGAKNTAHKNNHISFKACLINRNVGNIFHPTPTTSEILMCLLKGATPIIYSKPTCGRNGEKGIVFIPSTEKHSMK